MVISTTRKVLAARKLTTCSNCVLQAPLFIHSYLCKRFDTIVSLLLKGFILTYALLLQLTGERQTMSHYFRRR